MVVGVDALVVGPFFGGVGVDGDKEVGAGGVGQLGPLIEAHVHIGRPGQDHLVAVVLEDGGQLEGDGQVDVLLHDALIAGAGLVPAVAGVDDDGVVLRVYRRHGLQRRGGVGGDRHPAGVGGNGQVPGGGGSGGQVQHDAHRGGAVGVEALAVLGAAHAGEVGALHPDGGEVLSQGGVEKVYGHPVSQIGDPAVGDVVGGDGEHPVLPGEAGDLGAVLLGSLRLLRGRDGSLRLLLRQRRRQVGGVGGLVPGHLRPQLLRDEAKGDHGAVGAAVGHHLGGDAVGQRRWDTVDQGGGAVQGEDDQIRSVGEDDLARLLHPQDLGLEGLPHQADGHQSAPTLDHGGDVALEGAAVEGEGHHIRGGGRIGALRPAV